MNNPTYIFLDESGNFDFGKNGTHYFVLTSISTCRPFLFHNDLDSYKYDCLEFGLDIEYFHCADNSTYVRKNIFQLMSKYQGIFKIDSLIVEKQKTVLPLREDRCFYLRMFGYLLKHVLKQESHASQFIIITDNIPIQKKR